MKVSIEKQKDGTFIAYNIDGDSTIIGTGNSVSEAREDFLFSMEETKDMCKRHGLKEPEILGQVPEFKFDLSSLFEYYQIFNFSKLAEFVGINKSLMRQYKTGKTYVSEKQLRKIEEGIHKIGTELSELSLV